MFCVDDSFDFDDEEFAKVTQNLDSASVDQGPPAKRRSFELSCAPDAVQNTLHTKENDSPGSESPGWSSGVHHPETSQARKDGSNRAVPFKGASQVNRVLTSRPLGVVGIKQVTQPALLPTRGRLKPTCSAALSEGKSNRAVSAQGSIPPPISHPPISQQLPANRNTLPFAELDFDLDLDLDDATAWDPSTEPGQLNRAGLGRPSVAIGVCQNLAPTAGATAAAGCANLLLRPVEAATSNPCPAVGAKWTSSPTRGDTEHVKLLRPSISALRQAHRNSDAHSRNTVGISDAQLSAKFDPDEKLSCDALRLCTSDSNHIVPEIVLPKHKVIPANAMKGRTDWVEWNTDGLCRPLRDCPISTSPDLAQRQDTSTPVVGSSCSVAHSSRSVKSIVAKRKRKFPGPAGLLPRLKPGMDLEGMELASPVTPAGGTPQKQPSQSEADLQCSQSGEEVFSDTPWTTMRRELEAKAQIIVKEFTLSAIVRKATLKQLPRGKVPVMAALIDELNVHAADASALLRDPGGGRLKGTIHRQLLKDHGLALCPGAVLVMRQVGVFSPSARNHYLNITPTNVVRLYCRQPGAGRVFTHRLAAFTREDFLPLPASTHTDAEPQPAATSGQCGARGGVTSSGRPGTGKEGVFSTVGPGRAGRGSPGVPPALPVFQRSTPVSFPLPASLRPRAGTAAAHTPPMAGQRTLTPGLKPSWGASDRSVLSLTATTAQAPSRPQTGPRSTDVGPARPQTEQPPATPTGLRASTCTAPQDLWEDDQLDQLLTGLDDEMMTDF